VIFVLRHRDDARTKPKARRKNRIDAAHRLTMTAGLLRNLVVNLGSIRVNRSCDIHIVFDKTIEQRLR
jgi:hypothetical protein